MRRRTSDCGGRSARDGSAFVMLDPVQEQIAENQLLVVLDWFGELTHRMRGAK